jgi:hypothetical protein
MKIRACIIDPFHLAIRETAIRSTPLACSHAVGGFLRFGTWIGPSHALYLCGHPGNWPAFTINDRLVIGSALILGAGSGRRGLKTPASLAITDVEAIVRFDSFPDAPSLNAAVAAPPTLLEPRHPTSFRIPR